MKYIVLFMFIIVNVYAQEVHDDSDLIQLKDTSGLSEQAVRNKAEKSDANKNIKELQALWENQTPKTNGYDWVKTTKGEWFKGEIKAMYNESLEFDSQEMGIHIFDFEDIAFIKSHNGVNVNIEEVASVGGIIRYDGKKIKIIQGDKEYTFDKKQIVSFAPDGELERNFWSGKVSVSIDKRQGNKNQFDYSAKVNLKRRTDSSRLSLDYLGRTSSVEGFDTANDHRFTETFDVYITKRFFWTPLFSEYYTDKFQNIASQITASVGLGYTILDKRKLTWRISGGPGIVYTQYDAVENGKANTSSSVSFETRTSVEYELTKRSDITYDYKFTLTDKDTGLYKHHMILSLENELTSWLDLDLSMIWDHVQNPKKLEDGTLPYKDDYQMLIGLGVEF